ncbi:hypothetical protein Cob_v011839 [Colletotrichum orbiculare MAFF 240422]|uniref:Uncharacterized protein n=1 Tax=Colletotrichum orbiculare (strain 104-T / ATCC 96160 / CBS 514.97 / LARS 414 / MAFF 240422) TaxID=1213857 RepID=A0A484FD24_COLOR|nr:hypothetical protein Cob_v011839 [Colletotrichum orbiculare MAFF 240422]
MLTPTPDISAAVTDIIRPASFMFRRGALPLPRNAYSTTGGLTHDDDGSLVVSNRLMQRQLHMREQHCPPTERHHSRASLELAHPLKNPGTGDDELC